MNGTGSMEMNILPKEKWKYQTYAVSNCRLGFSELASVGCYIFLYGYYRISVRLTLFYSLATSLFITDYLIYIKFTD